FRPDESSPLNWNVAIISDALWKEQFNGTPDVLGRVVDMDGQPCRIVGVMAPDFEAFQSGVEAWMPLQIDRSSPFYTGATALAFGRLAPRATLASATTEIASLAPRMREAFNYTDDYGRGVTVIGLHESLVGNVRQTLVVLLGAVAVLILIASANVGNLLLVHAIGRERELAIRRALGATRGRLARHLLVQSVLLAAAGGSLGVAVGYAGLRGLKSILPSTL